MIVYIPSEKDIFVEGYTRKSKLKFASGFVWLIGLKGNRNDIQNERIDNPTRYFRVRDILFKTFGYINFEFIVWSWRRK